MDIVQELSSGAGADNTAAELLCAGLAEVRLRRITGMNDLMIAVPALCPAEPGVFPSVTDSPCPDPFLRDRCC